MTRVLTSHFNQEEWLNEQSELRGQSASTPGSSSASRSKIWVEETDQEGDYFETWQKLNAHALISGKKQKQKKKQQQKKKKKKKLQEQLDEAGSDLSIFARELSIICAGDRPISSMGVFR